MRPLRRVSIAEMCAEHLRAGLRAGRWHEALPGVLRLAAELDVSHDTVRAALRILEAEGLLGARGRGRSRTVTAQGAARHRLRIGILLNYPLDVSHITAHLLLRVQHSLGGKDYEVFFMRKSQVELKHDVRRIIRYLGENLADAWIVVAGSRELLEWVAAQEVPTLALYGRADGLPLARTGPLKAMLYAAVTRHLLEMGHRRIMLIAQKDRREPTPGKSERAFLDELIAHGILTGDYHLPDWEETPAGYSNLLERLFQHTPPTAMIIDGAAQFIATMEFLARRRIHVPDQVSLVSTDDDASLAWCHPGVALIKWDTAPIVRHIVRWVSAVRKGVVDRRTVNYPSVFVPGGSIGPVWKG